MPVHSYTVSFYSPFNRPDESGFYQYYVYYKVCSVNFQVYETSLHHSHVPTSLDSSTTTHISVSLRCSQLVVRSLQFLFGSFISILIYQGPYYVTVFQVVGLCQNI